MTPITWPVSPTLCNKHDLTENILNDLSPSEIHCSQYLLITSTNTLIINLFGNSLNKNLDTAE